MAISKKTMRMSKERMKLTDFIDNRLRCSMDDKKHLKKLITNSVKETARASRLQTGVGIINIIQLKTETMTRAMREEYFEEKKDQLRYEETIKL